MNIEITNNAGDIFVKLNERMDSTTADELRQKLNEMFEENAVSLTIDMSGVDYMSSLGLRVLVAAHKRLHGRPITLLSPNTSILEILRLSGLEKIMTVK